MMLFMKSRLTGIMIKEVSASTTLADAAAASLLWLLSPEKVAYPN